MGLHSSIGAIRAYRTVGSAERIGAIRQEAKVHPDGVAPWMLAIVLWEEGSITEAEQLASTHLAKEPSDFTMLVICLDFHLRNKNWAQIDTYARRLSNAKSPVGFRRIADTVVSMLLGNRGVGQDHTDAFDQWHQWAREYVKTHAVSSSEP
jgi:hypothetical protein